MSENYKKLLIGSGIIVAVLVVLYTVTKNPSLSKLVKMGSSSASVSPYILYITQPVYTLNGKVEKIQNNILFVSQTLQASPQFPPALMPQTGGKPTTPTPTEAPKTITLKILVETGTSLYRPPSMIPYLLKQNTAPNTSTPTIKDIKNGDYINVTVKQDLRTLPGDTAEATSISLPPAPNMINGRVKSNRGNQIEVIGQTPPAMMPAMALQGTPVPEKTYIVTIGNDTEISHMPFLEPGQMNPDNRPKPVEVSADKLVAGTQVTIYADTVARLTTITNFEAKLIVPSFPPPQLAPINPPTAPAVTTPSAAATPSTAPLPSATATPPAEL